MKLSPLHIELPWRRLAPVVLAVFALFSVLQLPTARLLSGFAAGLPWLHLAGLSGGPWSGDAEALSLRVGGKWLPLGRLHWQLERPSVFPPRIAWRLSGDAEGQSFSTRLRTGGGEISLHSARAFAPASIAHYWLPPEMAVKGSLFFRAEQLTLGPSPVLREPQLLWRDAVISRKGRQLPLGALRISADAMTADGGLSGSFESEGAELLLSGSWRRQAGKWQIEGWLTAGEALDKTARALLRDSVGAPEADGRYRLQLSW